ncbi:MAG: TlyA family RNA methyltransferase [Candidatus Saccharibacteria bacterium]|nr:TlyA family RNA methyltransferase [Candidatus Saccharibacteria bacterium]
MNRLDKELQFRKLVNSRSQAESYIKLGLVRVNNKIITKSSFGVSENDKLEVEGQQYVSRAALKLASIADQFKLDFRGKTVLDVGSSTGGFTDYALQHGAVKVIAVDVGTDQLHPSLHGDTRIELHEKTDIRDFKTADKVDFIVADVSFISLRYILPSLKTLSNPQTSLIMMCKPQFEAGKDQTNKGIIKNSAVRRKILSDFETWLGQNKFLILDKADSHVSGTKGNTERFYKLKSL